MESDVKSGKVNQKDILNQTSKMMGNLEEAGVSSDEIQQQASQLNTNFKKKHQATSYTNHQHSKYLILFRISYFYIKFFHISKLF